MSSSVQAVMTNNAIDYDKKCYRLGSLNRKNLLLTIMEAEKFKVKGLVDPVYGESLLPAS